MPEAITVLIVDDDRTAVKVLSDILMEKGYKVIKAVSGEEAVETARKERPRVVVLDTLLPGIDGHETCRRIKAIKGLDAKVVVTTGKIDAVDATKARAAGADDYVAKTSSFELLLSAVQKLAS